MEYGDKLYRQTMISFGVLGVIAVAGLSFTCGESCGRLDPTGCQDTMVVVNTTYADNYKCPPNTKAEIMTNPPGLMCRCINTSKTHEPGGRTTGRRSLTNNFYNKNRPDLDRQSV